MGWLSLRVWQVTMSSEDAPKRTTGAAVNKKMAMDAMKQQMGKSLADFNLEEEDDVYDVIDETEYAQVVEERRKKGDFVVDDGKCTCFKLFYLLSI